jgi:hypothetical protein
MPQKSTSLPANLGPHAGTYTEAESYPDYIADVLGGGGCPMSNDVLVPDLPFDFLQPQMRKQVTQAGYGGPFVIRSNPIGAIVDAIRNFCYPAPMEQVSSDGGVYADQYGMDGNLGGDVGAGGFPYLGQSGGGGFSPQNILSCGTGTMPDATNMFCVPTAGTGAMPTPTPTTGMDPCGAINLGIQQAKFAAATVTADVYGVCEVSLLARQCQMAPNSKPMQAAWKVLADSSKAVALRLNKGMLCDNLPPKPSKMAMTTSGMPMDNGVMTPAGGGSPGTNNSGMQGMTPTSGPGSGGMMKPPGMMTVINNPGAANAGAVAHFSPSAGQNVVPNRSMPRMPHLPNPMSLTEGNIYMTPAGDPMGGSFDPARAANPAMPRGTERRGIARPSGFGQGMRRR